MRKALIYARVSTEEQNQKGMSIDTQTSTCKKWAKDNGYIVPADGVYKDEGKSATTMNRPALQELLLRCREDKTVEVVLVKETDRLARNTLDHLTIRFILQKAGVKLISANQPGIDDSPEGNFIDTVIAAANTLSSQLTGRKVSDNLVEKARAGYWPGVAPLGYLNVDNPKPTSVYDKKIIIPDPEKASYMTQAFRLYATGTYNGQALADHLYEGGLRSKTGGIIHDSVLFNCLKNKVYIGKIPWKGEIHQGHHEPLTDIDTFNRCQEVMSAHNQNASRRRKHNYLLRGFIYCANCNGRRMWGEKHTKPSGLVFEQYFCPKCKKGTYIDINRLEKQVEHIFDRDIEITKEYANEMVELAKKILAEFRDNTDADTQLLSNRKAKIEAAIREAEDNWLIYKKINQEQYQKIYNRYAKELEGIEGQLSNIRKDYGKALRSIQALMGLALNIGDTYKTADYELKRYYLGLFFGGGGFNVKNGKIIKLRLSDAIKPLIARGSVRVRLNWLPLTNAFIEEPLILQVPQYEIEMMKQYLAVAGHQVQSQAFVQA